MPRGHQFGRTRPKQAIHVLNKSLQFRSLTPPKTNQPLPITFLARDTFQQNAQRWLTCPLHQPQRLAVPLTPPDVQTARSCHTQRFAANSTTIGDGSKPSCSHHMKINYLAAALTYARRIHGFLCVSTPVSKELALPNSPHHWWANSFRAGGNEHFGRHCPRPFHRVVK